MAPPPEHTDVLIVGAGISGIGLARHLQARLPGKRFLILEGRGAVGGTWDLFRYPGIRSDSDLFTFGYAFRPWPGRKSIADAPSILRYIRETAAETGVDEQIRLGHRVTGAAWSSADQRWEVRAETGDGTVTFTAGWLFSAAGYFRYDEGYTPPFEGVERFEGTIVHPQAWPEDLDHAGKRVLVIGSGATAVTLVPAMAERAEHVTMLQRTPTYVIAAPAVDPIARRLIGRLGLERATPLIRSKNVAIGDVIFRASRRWPRFMRRLIRRLNERALPEGFDVDRHFNPPYDPWDQRLCLAPDGDFFRAIRHGRASVATDRIATFTERGVLLESGKRLEADVVVTATGLNLQAFGGVDLRVDGEPIALAGTVTYKGLMLGGIPNFAYAIGYTNASWTLKVDLVCEHLCRLLAHMDAQGHAVAVPERPPAEHPTRPYLDFGAGYVQRALDLLPRQGSSPPWTTSTSYREDVKRLRRGPVGDHLRFHPSASRGELPLAA